MTSADDVVARWLAALEARHLADLRVPEVTRALRALSSAYVERRHKSGVGVRGGEPVRGALDTAGKRAAFALFYAPLHFFTVQRVLEALTANVPPPESIVDLGCGTGVAGAAWALQGGRTPTVLGLDRHPWAVAEARWMYREMGIEGHARQADISRLPQLRAGASIVAGWMLNELAESVRLRLEQELIDAAARGARVLVLEPIARSVVPWWDATASRVIACGGSADEWRFDADLPPLQRLLDKAAGLDHQELTVRTLFLDGSGSGGRAS